MSDISGLPNLAHAFPASAESHSEKKMDEENTSKAGASSTPNPNPQEGPRKPRFVVRIGLLLVSHCTLVRFFSFSLSLPFRFSLPRLRFDAFPIAGCCSICSAARCFLNFSGYRRGGGETVIVLQFGVHRNAGLWRSYSFLLLPRTHTFLKMLSCLVFPSLQQDLVVANQLMKEVFDWKFNSAEAGVAVGGLPAESRITTGVELEMSVAKRAVILSEISRGELFVHRMGANSKVIELYEWKQKAGRVQNVSGTELFVHRMGANDKVVEMHEWKQKAGGIQKCREIPRLIVRHMEDLDVEVYYHKFHAKRNQFHPLNFFSGTPYSGSTHENSSCSSTGINSVGVIRAPRGDGKEAIVLVTPYNSEKIKLSDALSLGLAYSVFSFLSRVAWLAKDVVWLAADSRYGEYASVAAWLRDYHNPIFINTFENSRVDMCISRSVFPEWKKDDQAEARIPEVTRRAGTMAAALIFKLLDRHETMDKDTLKIYAEASNGQMPNLDLINIVHYLAVHRQGLRVKVETVFSLLNSGWLHFVGNILEWLSGIAGSLNPQWRFAIPSQDFIEGAATLVSSMYHQALGVPTGSHGAFREYQVDAITLEISPMISLNNEAGHSALLLKSGRLIEGVIHSVNNLLEKFHQSFFLYFMTSPGKFVSVGVYMIAFMLLIMPLPILAAALYSKSQRPNCHQELGFAIGSWRWLHAAKVVLIVHFWGSMVSLLPYFIGKMPETTSTSSMTIWFMLSIFILLITHSVFGSPYPSFNNIVTGSHPQNVDWTLLKAVMIAATAVGLALMSVINFAAAQIGSLILVPMCLIARPLKDVYRAASLKAVFLTSLNIALAVIGFPPAALFISKSSLEGFSRASIGDFWDWTESLWAWNTSKTVITVHIQEAFSSLIVKYFVRDNRTNARGKSKNVAVNK
ncbi:hypothetical protein ACLOJK_009142 [Asimina triloba]